MNKVMILARSQFGYQTDYWKYATLLAERQYDVIYTGLHTGRKDIAPEQCRVYNFRLASNLIMRVLRYCREAAHIVKRENPDVILVQFWQGCFIYLFFLLKYRKKMVLDIRTGSIRRNQLLARMENIFLKIQVLLFGKHSCLSRSLIQYLKLPKDSYYLPLGGTRIERKSLDDSDGFHFLYVGTFHGRNLEQMLQGFAQFVKRNPSVKCSLTMTGDGPERKDLENLVRQLDIHDIVRFTGYVSQAELPEILLNHNVGICYVPITPQYDCQPPTKTYEYLLAGMPVIATATKENMAVVSEDNGVLTQDNAEAFTAACTRIAVSFSKYSVKNLQKSVMTYDWNYIVDHYLKAIINGVCSR